MLNRFFKIKARQKGQAIIEMTMSLIMFTIMIALISTVCMYLYLQHAVVSAAREGARAAAVNPDLADDPAAGEVAVETRVQEFISQTTGQTVDAADIVVTPPDPAGTFGQRDVQVQVTMTLENPIPIAGFVGALGATETSNLDSIPVTATASMRYEE